MTQLKKLVYNVSWPGNGSELKGRFLNKNDSVEETGLELSWPEDGSALKGRTSRRMTQLKILV